MEEQKLPEVMIGILVVIIVVIGIIAGVILHVNKPETIAPPATRVNPIGEPVNNYSNETIPAGKTPTNLSIVGVIYNDDKVSPATNIHFIALIKNISDTPSGAFKLEFFLDNKISSSMTFGSLAPGVIENTFVTGTGFGGFDLNKDTDMELKAAVTPLEKSDSDMTDNTYIWNFKYLTKPMKKHTCTYTDNNQGTEDYKIKASINYSGKIFTDFCADTNNVVEYNCDLSQKNNGDAGIEAFAYKCPNGCAQGACN